MRPLLKDAYHIALALGMVLLILGLTTWSGIISCRDIPGWCDVYYGIKGAPRTLIVYGDAGLGDPAALATALRNPQHVAATNISQQDIDFISAGNLKQFDLVIVTRARRMSTDTLRAFMEYADAGGRLVWTGDAGTEIGEKDQYLYTDDIDANTGHELISPWARKDAENNEQVRFDQYISTSYIGTWCVLRETSCNPEQQIGTLVPESGADHKLIFGIKQDLRLYGDFALVEDIGIGSTRVLSVDTETIVRDEENNDLGRVFPIIVTSGIGERVVYYAIHPEYFIREPAHYWLFLENLYD